MTLHKAAQAHVRVFVQVARLAKGQSCLASLFSQVLCILIPYLYLSFHLYLYLYTYPDQSGAMYFDLVFVFVFKLVFVFVFSSWLVRCFVIWSCIYMCLHTFIFSSYLYLSLYSHLDHLGALYFDLVFVCVFIFVFVFVFSSWSVGCFVFWESCRARHLRLPIHI